MGPVLANMESTREKHDTSPNVNYQQDIQYIFKPSSWILGSLGIWPIAIRGVGKYISKFAILVCNLALVFAMVPCILHIIYDQKDLNLRLKLSGLLGFCLTALTKYFILVIRQSKIQSCIEQVKNDWWQVGVNGVQKYILQSQQTAVVCIILKYSRTFSTRKQVA